jgi:glycosyltransferase involved in cell wall biosynthesis
MRIGFVATRLSGTDGVSLETLKFAEMARRLGHQACYCAGQLDPDGPPGWLIPEMFFQHPAAVAVGERAFSGTEPDATLLADIAALAAPLRRGLLAFVEESGIERLVIQNALAIPMHLPLGQALGQVIAETGLPTLVHHHDLYWERERFRRCRIPAFLDTYFPFDAPNVRHAVINSIAQRELRRRRGIEARLIPNVFDFDTPAPGIDAYNADFRAAIGLAGDDILILQPTRVIPRKGIELAIELVSRLQMSGCALCISHPAGDEGLDYLHALQRQADELGVDLRYVADRCGSQRGTAPDGGKIYRLWDAYPHADLVTYPSLYEGFGNALLETIYFRKPALVNRYPVYAADIAPLGFDFVEVEGRITDEAVAGVRRFLDDPERRQAAVDRNYELARQHFSYRVLADVLEQLLSG